MTTSRVWRFDGVSEPGDLYLADEELAAPGPGEARVEIRAIGLNRADLLFLAGHYLKQPENPSTLGLEAIGEVVELGPPGGPSPPGGFEPRIGERVGLLPMRVDYGAVGTYRTAGNYAQAALLPVPDDYTDEEGAALWVNALTAVAGLEAAGAGPESAEGQRVLVTAASSGVGVATLAAARSWGAKTLATTTSSKKVDRLRELADEVLLVEEPAVLPERIADATGGAGFDVAFDPVGFAYAPPLFEAAAVGGRIVFYGIMSWAEAGLDLSNLLRKDLAVHGFTVYRLLRDRRALDRAVRSVEQLAEEGAWKPIVASVHPFDRAPDALVELGENRHLGKIVVEIS